MQERTMNDLSAHGNRQSPYPSISVVTIPQILMLLALSRFLDATWSQKIAMTSNGVWWSRHIIGMRFIGEGGLFSRVCFCDFLFLWWGTSYLVCHTLFNGIEPLMDDSECLILLCGQSECLWGMAWSCLRQVFEGLIDATFTISTSMRQIDGFCGLRHNVRNHVLCPKVTVQACSSHLAIETPW
ncbi:hypothetical protein BU16DRAFT_231439 [Lophium mytilinum]|uniref:Uncharacterized protein n=1 Tax=Lophium mytilinum TaxID=390894 RepID=A0A6A6Q7T1_9PEZI|nr:hypothetical protein BU16DRAFT_231439 [Lophium mytilinum]